MDEQQFETLMDKLYAMKREDIETYLEKTYVGHQVTHKITGGYKYGTREKHPDYELTGMCNKIAYWDGKVIAHIRERRVENDLASFIIKTTIYGNTYARD